MATDSYTKLSDAEQCYFNIYTRLRQLSDWVGFTDYQDDVKDTARDWLQSRRKELWRCLQDENDPNNARLHRQARYNFLKDENLNTGSPRDLCQLPTGTNTDYEKALISEREVWWNQSSADPQTKSWRQRNADELTSQRKKLWHLIDDEGDSNSRQRRYDQLCVATRTGTPYDTWLKTHNAETGAEKGSTPGDDVRSRVVNHARSFVGVSEHPANSNKGRPQPSGWQTRVIGSDGWAWCACFVTCMAWDQGVKGGSSAGVVVIKEMAQRGQGMFRGWTTDASQVRKGDFAVVGCSTCHIGLVADDKDPCRLIEGNTSPSVSGDQFNGGCVAEKKRPRNNIVGWALVNYATVD